MASASKGRPSTLLNMHTAQTNEILVPQDDLDIAVKTRSNPLTWNGQFSPQLVHSLIQAYAREGSAILDPFAGSATVAGESITLGHSFAGIEINPAAYILGSLYSFAPLEIDERKSIINETYNILSKSFHDHDPPATGIDLQLIHSLKWSQCRIINIAIASIVMNTFRSSEHANVGEFRRARERVKELVLGLPISVQPVSMHLGDARSTGLENGNFDLIITSPPYINVFNYHQQYRPVVEALGCHPLGAAVSEIGANRKHRQNRFLTVVQYCLDIGHALAEIFRLCRRNGRIVMIVGRESSVLGVPFRNGDLVSNVAKRAFGLDVLLRQERKFVNRFGQLIYEDILHLMPSAAEYDQPAQDKARVVGLDALRQGMDVVETKSRDLLRLACLNASEIKASPMLASASDVLPPPLRPQAQTI